MANENIGVYEPGRDLSGRASAAVTGKRFLPPGIASVPA